MNSEDVKRVWEDVKIDSEDVKRVWEDVKINSEDVKRIHVEGCQTRRGTVKQNIHSVRLSVLPLLSNNQQRPRVYHPR